MGMTRFKLTTIRKCGSERKRSICTYVLMTSLIVCPLPENSGNNPLQRKTGEFFIKFYCLKVILLVFAVFRF